MSRFRAVSYVAGTVPGQLPALQSLSDQANADVGANERVVGFTWTAQGLSQTLSLLLEDVTVGTPVPATVSNSSLNVSVTGTVPVNVQNSSVPVAVSGTVPVHEQGTVPISSSSNLNVVIAGPNPVPTHEQSTLSVHLL